MFRFHYLAVAGLVAALIPAVPSIAVVASSQVTPVRRLVPPTDDNDGERHEGLQETIHRVRRSFLEGDTGRLDGCFSEKKVFVSLSSKAAEVGYYTRSQLHFIFDKMFRERQTRSFEHSPDDVTVSKDGRAFLKGEWTYMLLGSDDVVTEHLHLSFEKAEGGWHIYELKAVSK